MHQTVQIMKTISVVFLSFLFSISLTGQTLDEILSKHFKAIDQENFAKVKTVVMKGVTVSGSMENEYTMTIVKPDYYRLDVPFRGKKMVQAYNNGEAWFIAPWAGNEAKDATEDQLKNMAHQADLDGPLYQWKEKGNQLKLISTEELNGTVVYKIKVTAKNDEVSYIYMDTDSFLILKTEEFIMMQGKKVNAVNNYSDYKPVGDTKILMAHSIETYYNGQLASKVTVGEIEFNPKVDMEIFQKPTAAIPQK